MTVPPQEPLVTASLTRILSAAGVRAEPGEGDPASNPEYRFDVEHTVGLLAGVLARLHRIHVADDTAALGVPVLDPEAVRRRARTQVGEGRLRPEHLSEPYRHMSPPRLVDVLDTTRMTSLGTADGPLVLTHGAPTLGALRCRDGVALGFDDWSRAALADPYRDLAVAARSIATDLGPMLVPELFDRYAEVAYRSGDAPPAIDALRLDWYALAAELDT